LLGVVGLALTVVSAAGMAFSRTSDIECSPADSMIHLFDR